MSRNTLVVLATVVLLSVSVFLSLTLGASGITLWGDSDMASKVIWAIRAPRAVTAALAGGALAAAGVLSQGLFRNALASPSALGTEAGGSLTAVLLFYTGAAWLHELALPVAAFVGALLTTTFIFRLAMRRQAPDLATLLLAGFAVNAFAGALTSLVVSLALEDYQKAGAVMHWLLGGFNAKGWEHAEMVGVTTVLGLILALRLAPRLDVFALGEDIAQSLSVNIRSLRRGSIVAIAVLVGGAVAAGGAIPFVGLVVPHVTRLLAGPHHRRLLLLSTLNGMSLLLIADLIARTVRAPEELEVGILTSLLGAPFFLWLLVGKKRQVA